MTGVLRAVRAWCETCRADVYIAAREDGDGWYLYNPHTHTVNSRVPFDGGEPCGFAMIEAMGGHGD